MFAIFVLVFCLLMTAFSRGMGETYAVFLLPVSAHFGWERAAASSVYSVYMVSLGIGSPLAGLAFDRFGARFNYLLGAALLAVAYGMAGRLTELWQFYLFLGLCQRDRHRHGRCHPDPEPGVPLVRPEAGDSSLGGDLGCGTRHTLDGPYRANSHPAARLGVCV